ncbi:hypothetical protein [Sorangium sp. So ce406]|uniref:hypothetical protein n=1 Tax=Sorangium sp. So ce406 TaxID=3133311 RepID=UPI003F5B85B8
MGGSKTATGTAAGPLALPETEAQAPGQNGLFRLNYFNGRFLSAEGLRREQIYWDYRARLLGEVHPPGVAWGMSLDYDHAWTAPDKLADGKYQPKGGMEPGKRVVLKPGLAYNGIGQPVVVGADFEFTFAQLMDQFRSNKTVVVDGGTAFFPCVCLAPMPCGDMPAGQALPAGPYLLLIDPKDSLEGEAKVYTQVCPGKAPACEKDGIRGGFVLSLARFPVEVPMETIESSWDLRSILAAYYFGVYEHSLLTRWARPFPLDEGNKDFCRGPGPFDRVAGHVPLAMVYVGSDGTILFVDPWIPRRSIAATASAGWHANLRGAPTAPAIIARLHQFQCQVHDRFLAAGWPKEGGKKVFYFCPPPSPNAPATPFPAQIPNLYDLGFREIPPYGFLPLPPAQREEEVGKGPTLTLAYQRVLRASKAAKAYFKDTNVLVYSVVAVHDDDIFEDMVRAAEKDSIVLHRCGAEPRDERLAALLEQPIWGALFRIIGKCGGLSMERLINREIEAVKIVVPMEGLRRKYPIVGAVKADLSVAPYATWTAIAGGAAAAANGSLIDILFGDVLGAAARPHGFIFYVKQRLVLLDVLYVVLDVVLDLLLVWQTQLAVQRAAVPPAAPQGTPASPTPNPTAPPDRDPTGAPVVTEVPNSAEVAPDGDGAVEEGTGAMYYLRKLGLDSAFAGSLVNSFVPARSRDARYPTFDIATLRAANKARPLKTFSVVPMLLGDESARQAVVSGLLLWAPELGLSGTWSAYRKTRVEIVEKLRAARPNDPSVEAEARDQAIELLLREHKGFAALKLAAVTLPDTEVAALEELLEAEARTRGSRGEATLSQQAFYAKGYASQGNERWQAALDTARTEYGRRAISDIAPEIAGLPATPADKVLSSTKRNAARLVGGRASDRLAKKMKEDGAAIQSALAALAASKPASEPAFWSTYDEVLARSEGDDAKAIELLASVSPEHQGPAAELRKLHAALGERGYEEVLRALRGISDARN